MSRPVFALQRTGPEAELRIFGDIGESWDSTSITATAIADQLAQLPVDVSTIRVRINSYGGSVADGLAIHAALKRHPARVVASVEGVAASIASLIAMAGDDVEMAASAVMMVHAPWTSSAAGNAPALREAADMLDAHARAMAEAYASKTRRPVPELLALLQDGKDHWFTAPEAVAFGLADRLIEAASETVDATTAWHAFSGLGRFIPRAPATARAHLSRIVENAMSAPNTTPPTDPQAQALAAVRDRNAQIRGALKDVLEVPGVRAIYDAAMLDPTQPVEQVLTRALAAQAAVATPCAQGGFRVDGHEYRVEAFGQPNGSSSDFAAAASDAMLMRAGFRVDKPHPAARDLRGLSVVELARTSLGRAGRTMLGADSPAAVVKAALTTSDFPLLLGDSLRKSLRAGAEAEQATHRTWCAVTDAIDFKTQSRVILGSAPDLAEVPERAEYTHGPLAEDRNTLTPVKFGRLISASYEMLVNDDLGGFLAVGRSMGQAAMRCESDKIYSLLLANAGEGQQLSDGVNLFASARNNSISIEAGSAKRLSAEALSVARTKMRRQTNVGGGLLNLTPRVLIVPPEREHEAEVLVAAATVHTGSASAETITPSWIRGLIVVAEPRLSSVDVFYLAADTNLIGTAEIAIVGGPANSPMLDEFEDKQNDTLVWKVRHAFAAGFVDFRGMVKGTLTIT